MEHRLRILVDGDYACFTRPELKVERVSYEVPPPGALEGLLKSVYWKPAIRYVIDRIIVFSDIQFANIRRNEVSSKVSLSAVKSQMRGKGKVPYIYTSECRSQRSSMVLKDVCYGIEFHIEATGLQCEKEFTIRKHEEILKRRISRGQYFRKPVLGCSEFGVRRILLTDAFDLSKISPALAAVADWDLGYMSYRVQFEDGGNPVNHDWEHPRFSDRAETLYYRPHLKHGVIDVETYRKELKC